MRTYFVTINANVWGWVEAQNETDALRKMAIRHKLTGRIFGRVRLSTPHTFEVV